MAKEFDAEKVSKLFKKILSAFEKAERDLPSIDFAPAIRARFGENEELVKKVSGLYYPTHLLAMSLDKVSRMSLKKVKPGEFDRFQKFVGILVFSYLFEKTLPPELGRKAILVLESVLQEEEEDRRMYG